MIPGRLAQDAIQRGEIERARGLVAESARLAEATGFVRGQAITAQLLAGLERAAGRPARAAELLERSAELAAESSFTWWQALTLAELAELEIEQGHADRGKATARRALALLEQVGDRQNTVYVLAILAGLTAREGVWRSPDISGAPSKPKRDAARSGCGSRSATNTPLSSPPAVPNSRPGVQRGEL